MQFTVLTSLALAGLAAAVPAEKRWFNTCNFDKQGTRAGAAAAAAEIIAQGSKQLTVGRDPVILASVVVDGVPTVVSAFTDSVLPPGTLQTTTYEKAGQFAAQIGANGCPPTPCTTPNGVKLCWISSAQAMPDNANLVISVYGEHNGFNDPHKA